MKQRTKEDIDKILIEFAIETLCIMEATSDWAVDLGDLIADAAFEKGIARLNSKNNMFEVTNKKQYPWRE